MKVVSVALRRCLPTPHAADHETQAVHNRDEEPYRNSFRRNCAGIVRIDCQDSEDERDAVGPPSPRNTRPSRLNANAIVQETKRTNARSCGSPLVVAMRQMDQMTNMPTTMPSWPSAILTALTRPASATAINASDVHGA